MRILLRILTSLVFTATCFSQRAVFLGQNVTASGGGGAISIISHTCAGSTDGMASFVTTAPINTTGATEIVLFSANYAPDAASTITDSKSNAWSALTRYGPGVSFSGSQIVHVDSPTTDSAHTFTATSVANGRPSLCVVALANTALSSVFDVQNGNNGSTGATTCQTGSVTPTQNNEIIIAALATQSTGTFSIDSGFTILDQLPYVSVQSEGIAFAYKIQTTAAAVNPTWTVPVSDSISCSIATFKAP